MPDPPHISTSYAERANLTMLMGMRRFTRLTNAFSKKVENDAHMVSLHMMYYTRISRLRADFAVMARRICNDYQRVVIDNGVRGWNT